MSEYLINAAVTLGTTLCVGVLIAFAKSWAKEQGALGAKQSIENHKAELQKEAARLGADLKKSVADDAIFVKERHKALAAVNAGFMSAINRLNDIEDLQQGANLEAYARRFLVLAQEASPQARNVYTENSLYVSGEPDRKAIEVCNILDFICRQVDMQLQPQLQLLSKNGADAFVLMRYDLLGKAKGAFREFTTAARSELQRERPSATGAEASKF